MCRTLPWSFLLTALFGVCVAPNAWGWSELFDRFNDVKPGARMVDLHLLIESEARRQRLPAHFVAAIVQIESAAQPCARSHANAAGLMQIMPSVSRRYGVDAFEPRSSVAAGTAHLAEALDLAGGNPRLAAAVYNAGSKVLGLPESSWPAETREYVNRKLPRIMPSFQGDGWRRHLPRYVASVDRHQCHLNRSGWGG